MNVQNPAALPTGRAIESAIQQGYMSGFGNGFETEALPGALPLGRNSPQKCAYGLYAEQLSGSLHRAAHHERALLALPHPPDRFALEPVPQGRCRAWRTAPAREVDMPLAPLRWSPILILAKPLSFVEGMHSITTAGDAGSQGGMGAHVYLVTRSMVDEYFYNADGEMLFVPQEGSLRLWTEFGIIDIEPGEIAAIPRGVKIRVELKKARRAAISARTMAAPSLCPSVGRSVPTAWPIRATSSRPSQPMRIATRRRKCS